MGAYTGNRQSVMCPFMLEASTAVCAFELAQHMGFLNRWCIKNYKETTRNGGRFFTYWNVVDEAKAKVEMFSFS